MHIHSFHRRMGEWSAHERRLLRKESHGEFAETLNTARQRKQGVSPRKQLETQAEKSRKEVMGMSRTVFDTMPARWAGHLVSLTTSPLWLGLGIAKKFPIAGGFIKAAEFAVKNRLSQAGVGGTSFESRLDRKLTQIALERLENAGGAWDRSLHAIRVVKDFTKKEILLEETKEQILLEMQQAVQSRLQGSPEREKESLTMAEFFSSRKAKGISAAELRDASLFQDVIGKLLTKSREKLESKGKKGQTFEKLLDLRQGLERELETGGAPADRVQNAIKSLSVSADPLYRLISEFIPSNQRRHYNYIVKLLYREPASRYLNALKPWVEGKSQDERLQKIFEDPPRQPVEVTIAGKQRRALFLWRQGDDQMVFETLPRSADGLLVFNKKGVGLLREGSDRDSAFHIGQNASIQLAA